MIFAHTANVFHAQYKGKRINITTDHGFGSPRFSEERRFMIDVIDMKTDMLDVDALKDCLSMTEAITYALEGACLAKSK